MQIKITQADMDRMRRELRETLPFLGVVCACTGAGIATLVAWLARRACEANCRSLGLLRAQLILALVGLIPAAVLLYATAFSRKRLAVCALLTGLAIYTAWGLLNNLAVHGSLFGG